MSSDFGLGGEGRGERSDDTRESEAGVPSRRAVGLRRSHGQGQFQTLEGSCCFLVLVMVFSFFMKENGAAPGHSGVRTPSCFF